MRLLPSLALSMVLMTGGQLAAAQDQTLADIRQELSVLYVEIQKLKRELSTTGGVSMPSGGGSALQRLDQIEAELGRLTGTTERLESRINSIVADGTNRIGDLEFRLVELEGGDVSTLGETTTLGGAMTGGQTGPAPTSIAPTEQPQLAMAEQSDFDQARGAYDAGNFQDAAVKFTMFTETYPVGPLTGEAHFFRGEALSALGDTPNAARAYLESFSGAPDNPRAADALMKLGLSLNDLGQTNEACLTLAQVPVRYPDAAVTPAARDAAASLNCQ